MMRGSDGAMSMTPRQQSATAAEGLGEGSEVSWELVIKWGGAVGNTFERIAASQAKSKNGKLVLVLVVK